MNRILQNKKGVSILLVILILASILAIALGVSDLVFSGLKMGKVQTQSTKAFFAAESGVEEILWEIRKNNFNISENTAPSGEVQGSDYEVSYNGVGNISFLSLGNNSGVKRSIEVSFTEIGGFGGGAIPDLKTCVEDPGLCLGGCNVCDAESGECFDDNNACTNPEYCYLGTCIACKSSLECPSPTERYDCVAGQCVCEPGLWDDCDDSGDCECDLSVNQCDGSSCIPISKTTVNNINLLNSKFSGGLADVVFIGGTANPYHTDLIQNCSSNWYPQGSLCDEGDYVNSRDVSYKSETRSGATWNDGGNNDKYGTLIIDLKSVQTFDELRVFQMFSDGKTTHIRFAIHSESGDNYPTEDDSNWVYLNDYSLVGAGIQNGNEVSDPTIFSFSDQSTRYLKIDAKNMDNYGNNNWIELRNVKMFNN